MGDVKIEYPADPNDVPYVYSNLQRIYASDNDVFIDFAQTAPQTGQFAESRVTDERARLCSRVIMTPQTASRLAKMIEDLLAQTRSP